MNFTNDTGLLLLLVSVPVVVFGLLLARRRQSFERLRFSLFEIALKALIVALLCIAVSDPYLETVEEHSEALLLVDVSDSVDEAVGQSLLERVNQYESEGVAFEVIPFSKSTGSLAVPLNQVKSFRKLKNAWSKLDIGATDLEQALEMVGGKGVSNILLISDGHETSGDAEQALPLLQFSGARVFPLAPVSSDEKQGVFRISYLHAPLIAPAKKSVDIRVSVLNSTQIAQRALLKITHDQEVIFEEQVEVPGGSEQLFVASSDPLQEGIKEVTATLQPVQENLAVSSQTVYVSGEEREKILLVSSDGREERFLKEVLQKQAYQLEPVLSRGKQLAELPEFSKYTAVIFNNVPVTELPRGSAARVERYVAAGGGFLMLGGNKSFGLGGYRKTSIEEILPVSLLPPQKEQKRLNIGVQLVLDKSGSMKNGLKIEYAKEAAREVIRTLKDDDYVGVVAFDQAPFHLVKIGQLQEIRAKALKKVDLLFPNLTTRLMTALDIARRDIERVPAGRRHMIILTDGKIPDAMSNRNYYIQLVQEMRMMGVTVSTILIGSERAPLLQEIADVGGGAFYRTRNARTLPRLFLDDIRVNVGEKTQKENTRYDVRQGDGAIKSTELDSFPPVLGYVQTKKKPEANLELVAFAQRRAEPLLASWRYKKGKSIAYTSDVSGRWSYHWVGWRKFHQFWTDLVDAVRAEGGETLDNIQYALRYFVEKGSLILDLSVYSEAVSGNIAASLTPPDGAVRPVDFTSLSRGHYQAKVDGVLAGRYELNAKVGARDLTPVAFFLSGELFGEKKGAGFDRSLLEYLASATGGKVNPPAKDLKGNVTVLRERKDVGAFFVALAIVLLCIEILRREVFRFRKLRLPRLGLKTR